jgi:hypothetical protein
MQLDKLACGLASSIVLQAYGCPGVFDHFVLVKLSMHCLAAACLVLLVTYFALLEGLPSCTPSFT